jgi:hypothetical protein
MRRHLVGALLDLLGCGLFDALGQSDCGRLVACGDLQWLAVRFRAKMEGGRGFGVLHKLLGDDCEGSVPLWYLALTPFERSVSCNAYFCLSSTKCSLC